jgi:hypothetical protein
MESTGKSYLFFLTSYLTMEAAWLEIWLGRWQSRSFKGDVQLASVVLENPNEFIKVLH